MKQRKKDQCFMIKAVIFDMFETLITHYESPLYMGRQIAADIGITENKFREIWNTSEEDRTLGKKTLENVIEEVLRVNELYSKELFDKIIEKRILSKRECFEHIHTEIIPLLKELKTRNIKIGLISNCYSEECDVIKDSILFEYFDSACMSCELGMKKPDVRIFEKCMKDLEVSPEECIYVGDGGSRELETARKLGMNPVQAVWYLKEEIPQLEKRKPEFLQAESPFDILYFKE
jgi:putative hydrolase of the HAD superfamily